MTSVILSQDTEVNHAMSPLVFLEIEAIKHSEICDDITLIRRKTSFLNW